MTKQAKRDHRRGLAARSWRRNGSRHAYANREWKGHSIGCPPLDPAGQQSEAFGLVHRVVKTSSVHFADKEERPVNARGEGGSAAESPANGAASGRAHGEKSGV